jgi:hypothetical protein
MWTRETVLYLLEKIEVLDKQFETGVKKNVGSKIAQDCSRNFNKPFTYKQVDGKRKGLKRTYKSILMHNRMHNTTGKNRRHWEFFNKIHNFMHKKPKISPEATCSSSAGLKVQASTSSDVDNSEEVQHCADTEHSTDTTSPFVSSFTKKRKARQSDVAKRHNEKMRRCDRFNDLFEEMVKNM